MNDSPEAIASDVAAVGRISAVPSLLKLICQNTGMGFAAVARVTEGNWTACAVQDEIAFGLKPGGQLEVRTTLCMEAREKRQPVVIDHASEDPVYCGHPTTVMYNIESYISVPIIRPGGEYFGNLCAIDPKPRLVSDEKTLTMFRMFADLIALQLVSEDHHQEVETALASELATAELREQFIAVVGHDLRNPLAAVKAVGDLLSLDRKDQRLSTMGERLKRSTRRMSQLIDDVLDFTRGRLGTGIGLAFQEDGNLADALHDVVAELRLANPGRTVLEDIRLECVVRADRGRIQQLLSNLLANALSYGAPDRAVRVSAAVDGNALVLAVLNYGKPIDPADLQRVFEPYWRSSDHDRAGGLGLGLYISSQIAKAHGGELRVESSEQAGTCFTASLPVVVRPA